ncbi:hypothetical protein LCGC14_1836160 [marine sediment metagenome]|uniref:Uncharacterized protein n=1 Tax=marine sediment metagenome TaxID=412755 RepID=A0A0F9GEV9_9ZZZZ
MQSKTELQQYIDAEVSKRFGDRPTPRIADASTPEREGVRERLGFNRNAKPKLVCDRYAEFTRNYPAHIINNSHIEAIDYARRKMV